MDSLGYDDAAVGAAAGSAGDGGGGDSGMTGPSLAPLTGPDAYPNPFREELGKSEQDIEDRIASVYRQLFRGDEDEVIFYEEGPGEASIRDILHGDIRTEGIGLGMFIAVQRNERADFDALYTYAKNQLAGSGSSAGYFKSKCDGPSPPAVDCFDPYGMQVMTMSLVFAHGRWQSDGAVDYEAEALAALDVMLNKEKNNGGTPDGITDMFSRQAKLAFDVPHTSAISFTRPALAMPGFYALWQQATKNPFWGEAAEAARDYLLAASHAETGLTPLRSDFTGAPVRTVPGFSDIFEAQSYRVHLNLVLDLIWNGPDERELEVCDRLIAFFASAGIGTYGSSYELDGVVVEMMRDPALVVVNGVAAFQSAHSARVDFMRRVWDMPTVKGEPRYYSGILTLFSLMVLGGQMQVY